HFDIAPVAVKGAIFQFEQHRPCIRRFPQKAAAYYPLFFLSFIAVKSGVIEETVHLAIQYRQTSGESIRESAGQDKAQISFAMFRLVECGELAFEIFRRFGSGQTDGTRRTVFAKQYALDRKSTRLNSSHVKISYAVFC